MGPSLQSLHSGPFSHHWQTRFLRQAVVCHFRLHETHSTCLCRAVARSPRNFFLELMAPRRRCCLGVSSHSTAWSPSQTRLLGGSTPPLRLEGPSCPCFVPSSTPCAASAAEVLAGGSNSSALRFMMGARAAAWGKGGGRVWGGGAEKSEVHDTMIN